jgi:cytoskeleton protein RodZ
VSINDFGGKLRQARERRGVSLRQIAASTKISVAALEALERNDVSKLPGGIFSRAFVRSYAAEVGLDPDETVREFLERFHGEPPPSAAQPAAAAHHAAHAPRETPARVAGQRAPLADEESHFESQQRMAGVLLKLLVVSLPLAAIILYLTVWKGPSAKRQPANGAAPPATQPDARTPSTPEAPVETPRRTPAPPPSTTPAAKPAPAAAPPPVVPAEQPLVLELHPTGPCWISLTVDGQVVMSRLMQPGEKEVQRIRDNAVIEVGDAGAFAFTINGRPGRSLGETGQVKTAKISRATLAEYVR